MLKQNLKKTKKHSAKSHRASKIINKIHTERANKYKIYALFQFFSTTSIFMISLALGLTVYIGVTNESTINKDFFRETFKSVVAFNDAKPLNMFVSLATYCSFFFWIFSICFALMQIKNKRKSIFDLAFLLFFFVPLLSNVITVFCQMSEVFYKTPSEFVDKYKTKIEYLRELEKYAGKEKNVPKQQGKK